MRHSQGIGGISRPSRSFEVGLHVIRVTQIVEGRWLASVDETPCDRTYPTSADAWEAGVRTADRIDRSDDLA